MKTSLLALTSGSSGRVGTPSLMVPITMPRPPLSMTTGYAPMPWPGKTTGASVSKVGSQFSRLSQSASQYW